MVVISEAPEVGRVCPGIEMIGAGDNGACMGDKTDDGGFELVEAGMESIVINF